MRSSSMFGVVLAVLLVATTVRCDDEKVPAKNENTTTTLDWATPVLNAAMCPLTKDPWDCGRQQAARMLDVFLADVEQTKQEIKDEADADLADRIAQRAFSESELPAKEKPSAVMTTLDSYLTNSILSFMGRTSQNQQQEHMKKRRKPNQHHHQTSSNDQHHPDHEKPEHHHEHQHEHNQHEHEHGAEHEEDEEEEEEEDDEPQQFQGHHDLGLQHGAGLGGHRRPHHGGLGHRHPIHHKYGRDLGVTRGKKHKKKFKKAIMKLLIVAAVLKVKLEFFLKVLATHLQVKFFIIALLGLLLNAAKFWIDLKKGHNPQKVIYYEHAQHQHHYDDHGDEGWGGGGGYWKRSFDNEDTVSVDDDDNNDAAKFEERAALQAYRQSRGASGDQHSAHTIAYRQQKPANGAL